MVAIAGNAIKKQYPITAQEISKLCRELDMETGNWYENRPLDKEADRALEYVYRNG
jgi:DNA-binding Xre family transcriptional regulator